MSMTIRDSLCVHEIATDFMIETLGK